MYRPKGGWNLPSTKVMGRVKPVKKCRKCARPMAAKSLCHKHYQENRRKLKMRVSRKMSRRDYKLWQYSVFARTEVRLLGGWIHTLYGDGWCHCCGGPTAYGVCPFKL